MKLDSSIARALKAQYDEEIARLRAQLAEARAIIRGFLDCPEIADCAPEDKDPDTDGLERKARAVLARNSNQGSIQ